MFSTRVFTAVIAALFLQAGSVLGGETSNGVGWVDDYKEALRIARRESMPILLDFWTTWCPPCRAMEESFWPDPEVIALTRKFVCVKLDGDQVRGLVARYRANAFPTMLFLDPWGEELARLSGYEHDSALVLLRGLPDDFSPIVAARAQAKNDGRVLRPLVDLARFYGEHELYQISTGYYEKALKTQEAKNDHRVAADLMTSIGWNELRIGEYRRARRTFERCLKKEGSFPGLDRTLYGLLRACLSLDDEEDARSTFERLCAECPTSSLIERARTDLGGGGR